MKHKLLFALLSLLLFPLGVVAQNVTISPTTGNLVSAGTDAGETGFQIGSQALWRHEQLALSLTGADRDIIMDNGEIGQPSAVLKEINGKLAIIGGHRQSFLVVSLPKGYRITRYKIVLSNDLLNANVIPNGKTLSNQNYDFQYRHINTNCQEDNRQLGTGVGIMRFYETEKWTTGGTNCSDGNGTVGGVSAYTRWCYINDNQIGTVIKNRATDANNNYDIRTDDESGKEYTIERVSQTDNDMGNQLYFRLIKNYHFYGISIKSFEIYFTAEGTFDALAASSGFAPSRSYVTAPFETSKIDIGKLEPFTKDGQTYYSYNYQSVTDLQANISIYQDDAVTEDGAPADIAEKQNIHPVRVNGQNQFAFENDIYYVEPPISVHTSSGLDAPIGFRIVGAKFNYNWGSQTTGGTQTVTGYQIISRRDNNNYFLNDQLNFTRQQYTWLYDEETHCLYYLNGNTKRYLSCTGSGDTRTLTTGTERNNWYNLILFSSGNNTYVGWDNEDDTQKFYLRTTTYTGNNNNRVYSSVVERANTTNAATPSTATTTITLPNYNPGHYILKVYDKTGEQLAKQANGQDAVFELNSASDTGTFELSGLNNDAVKFEIDGLATGTQALVNVTLQLQALNPYINSMNIVCKDTPKELQMTQTFTASDFRVSGGEFIFYVPSKYEGQTMNLEFAALRSDFGDETYPGGTNMHYSRYSFVTSDYFMAHQDLYDDPEDVWSSTSDDKIITTTAGNIRFEFNNAEELTATGEGTKPSYLIEEPFTVEKYIGSADPDDGDDVGAFISCQVEAGSQTNAELGTFYLFTADEPRYNIAPTKAWQHRSYAFYRMDIKVVAKDYDPHLEWTKVYDTSLYSSESDGSDLKTDSQWGLKVTTYEKGTTTSVKGYLTYEDIIDQLQGRAAQLAVGTEGDPGYVPAQPEIVSKLDPNGVNAPKSMDQILYVDGTGLLSINESSIGEGENKTTIDENTLKSKLGTNALIFLPKNMTSDADNVAYMTMSGSFDAGKNIVIQDRFPFFTPYDIQVSPANYATHTRQITVQKNGKVTNASVMLPFTLSLSGGVHTNPADAPGGGQKFTVNELGSDVVNIVKDTEDGVGPFDHGIAYFTALSESNTEANKPYMIMVTSAPTENQISFIASQNGSLIVTTPHPQGTDAYTHTGELIKGFDSEKKMTFAGQQNLVFTNYGTYSGAQFSRDKNEIFYFANNQYLSMTELAPNLLLNMYPFRAVYAYSVGTPSRDYTLKRFDISYDEPNLVDVTGIGEMSKNPDLTIRSDKGCMIITASKAQDVTIYSVNGICVAKATMQGGDTQTVNLPTGVYFVNNVKIAVK